MLTSLFPVLPQFSDPQQDRHEWTIGGRHLKIYRRSSEYFRTYPTGELEGGIIGEGETFEGLFEWLTEPPQPSKSDRITPLADPLVQAVDEAIAAYHSGRWNQLEVAIGRLQELREAQKS